MTRNRDELAIGKSAMSWDGVALTISVNELAVPFPSRIRGAIRLEPTGLNTKGFALDAAGRHIWRPIAPSARVSVDLTSPALHWRGEAYFDTNTGSEPLEAAFANWSWSRAMLSGGAAILYEAERRGAERLALALRFDKSGRFESLDPPPVAKLPLTRWRMARQTRADDGEALVARSFEDTPFYARSLVHARLFGEPVASVHESLSLDRLANPLVRLMLPFRMPRRG